MATNGNQSGIGQQPHLAYVALSLVMFWTFVIFWTVPVNVAYAETQPVPTADPEQANPPQADAVENDTEKKDLERNDAEQAGDEASLADSAAALQNLVDRMRKTSEQIDSRKLGDPTQQLQVQSLKEIDELIKHCELQSSSQPSPNSQPKQNQPGDDKPGTNRPGTNQKPGSDKPSQQGGQNSGQPSAPPDKASATPSEADPNNLRATASKRTRLLSGQYRADRIWGHLPQQLRQRLSNVEYDEPLIKYRELVERYYEALANPDSGSKSPK